MHFPITLLALGAAAAATASAGPASPASAENAVLHEVIGGVQDMSIALQMYHGKGSEPLVGKAARALIQTLKEQTSASAQLQPVPFEQLGEIKLVATELEIAGKGLLQTLAAVQPRVVEAGECSYAAKFVRELSDAQLGFMQVNTAKLPLQQQPKAAQQYADQQHAFAQLYYLYSPAKCPPSPMQAPPPAAAAGAAAAAPPSASSTPAAAAAAAAAPPMPPTPTPMISSSSSSSSSSSVNATPSVPAKMTKSEEWSSSSSMSSSSDVTSTSTSTSTSATTAATTLSTSVIPVAEPTPEGHVEEEGEVSESSGATRKLAVSVVAATVTFIAVAFVV